MEDSKNPEALSVAPTAPISYRRVQIGLTDWAVVDSFTNLAQWHAAKGMLDRNGVMGRMASNPLDDNVTDLLVPFRQVDAAIQTRNPQGDAFAIPLRRGV